MPSAQLPQGCINAFAPMIHNATTVALVIDGGDRFDIMSSICEVSLSIHRRLVKKLSKPGADPRCVMPDRDITMMRESLKMFHRVPARGKILVRASFVWGDFLTASRRK
ncbi:MAG: hypothetical protein AAB308_02110 [Nitrospirota bacterium]